MCLRLQNRNCNSYKSDFFCMFDKSSGIQFSDILLYLYPVSIVMFHIVFAFNIFFLSNFVLNYEFGKVKKFEYFSGSGKTRIWKFFYLKNLFIVKV